MFLAVWTLYAADRLLDAQPFALAAPAELEARHLFHHRHRRLFLVGIAGASLLLAFLLPHLDSTAIHLDLILGALLFGYFILIHATCSAFRLPKEIAVGVFFSAATFLPTVARRPDLQHLLAPSALLFAALCSLNCLFIYAWEHRASSREGEAGSLPAHAAHLPPPALARLRSTTSVLPHPHAQVSCNSAAAAPHLLTRWAVRHLAAFSLILILGAGLVAAVTREAPLAAIALAASLLLLLHRWRDMPSPTTLRAAADLSLLTPLLLLPFLPGR